MNQSSGAYLAAALAIILYVAVPWFANQYNWIAFQDPSRAMTFLAMTAFLLAIQVLFISVYTESFSFLEHGFELTVAAFAGFATMTGTSILKKTMTPPVAFLGMLGTLGTLVLSLKLASGSTRSYGHMHPGVRLANYVIGATVHGGYLAAMLSEGIP